MGNKRLKNGAAWAGLFRQRGRTINAAFQGAILEIWTGGPTGVD
jgi:hypothetical protein